MTKSSTESSDSRPRHFIQQIIDHDMETGKYDGRVHTRFPPEPNGFLHIGHAKAICLSFGLAEEYSGLCNLRFDDTNPIKEEDEYVKSIIKDVRWLGFDWEDRLYFASDYFDQLYKYAVQLVRQGQAYVDELTADEIRKYRGTLKESGKESPYRDRPVDENLDLLERMRKGEFEDGKMVLRAKIDMAHSNMNMRDPVIYRILHASHHRTGDEWCIYPMYDWAHGLEDSIERITHSLCTLEFENHRPLYDWFLIQLGVYRPQQIEFARLNLSYTVMSKRKLALLVKEGIVDGWDDPRMPTISGFRRRGFTPESIRNFSEQVGVAKADNVIDVAKLEHCLRDDLNRRAERRMAVLDPVKVIIKNYPEDQVEELDAENNPEDESAGKRMLPFSREIFIERSDFMVDPPKKYFRLAPGKEVRLKHAYYITCTDYKTDPESGEITEIYCTYDPDTRGGWSDDGRKVRGTLNWVSATHAVDAEVRLYDRLFDRSNSDKVDEKGKDFRVNINPDSLTVLSDCKLEPALAAAKAEDHIQFLRHGYFCVDSRDSTPDHLVFNRSVALRDSWKKREQAQKSG